MKKTIAKGTLVAVLAAGVSAGGWAQEMRSEYSEIDLEDCTTVFVYEAGAGWACPGLRGFPLLVAERDLRFVVSFGFSAFDEKAFEQRFMRFNSTGVTLEWLVAEDDEMGPIPVAAIQRFYLDGYEEGDRPDEVLVVTRIEEGNTCQVAHIDAHANPEANALAREAAAELLPGFDCASQDPVRVGAWAVEGV